MQTQVRFYTKLPASKWQAFTALLLRRKYVLWRCALGLCEVEVRALEALGMGGGLPAALEFTAPPL